MPSRGPGPKLNSSFKVDLDIIVEKDHTDNGEEKEMVCATTLSVRFE